jgi:hypothetical protein
MTGKTLKELNVQVGDVVKSTHTGYSYEVQMVDMTNNSEWHVAKWEIVSRAKKYTAWQFTAASENAETHTMPDGSIAWRVEVKPVVNIVTKYMRADNGGWTAVPKCTRVTHKLTYATIDGEIDCESVKMVKL